MGRIQYVISRAVRMDFRAMWKTARMLHEKTGKSTAWLLQDMMHCAVRYNAGYMDYKIAEMWRLTPAQRATQITRGISNHIVASMNDKAYWHFFDRKDEFNTLFAAQVRRPWRLIQEGDDPAAWADWLKDKDSLIFKPVAGSSGQGVVKYVTADWEADTSAFLRILLAQGGGIIEECVQQHPALAALCPTSVNTLRIATLLGEKQKGIVYAYIRIGNGKVMDNVDCGGMAAPIDLQTGCICGPGADKSGHQFDLHPMTKAVIKGTQIPFWQEAVDLCLAAMKVVPQVRFVAWDVAITETGPVFIEGNSFPSHAIPQFAAHFPDGIGILPRFRAFIDF